MERLSAVTGRGTDNKRVVAIAGGAIAAVVLLSLALVFTNAYGSEQVAANARALHWTNATLGSASIARASNAQAVVFTVDDQLGVADAEAAVRARDEARGPTSTTWKSGSTGGRPPSPILTRCL